VERRVTVYTTKGIRTSRTCVGAVLRQLHANPVFAIHVKRASCDDESLLSLLAALGPVSTTKRNPEPIRRISPVSVQEAPPNTLSSRFGTSAFPFHTDGAHWCRPPTFLSLYCDSAGETQRPTYLLPTTAFSKPTRRLLEREHWIVNTGTRAFFTTVMSKGAIRFDRACMNPLEGDTSELVVTEIAADRRRHIRVDWDEGDLLIIANDRCLHSRGDAERRGTERVLARVLIGGIPWQ